jgi:predicted membrane-bound mannosyltransferase
MSYISKVWHLVHARLQMLLLASLGVAKLVRHGSKCEEYIHMFQSHLCP